MFNIPTFILFSFVELPTTQIPPLMLSLYIIRHIFLFTQCSFIIRCDEKFCCQKRKAAQDLRSKATFTVAHYRSSNLVT